MTNWVAQALEALADLHADRASVYGDDYLHSGEVMLGLFPRGLTLTTAEDFNRFVLYVHLVTKMGRYAQAMARKEGHVDSLDDLSVYGQLLQNHDRLAREGKSEPPVGEGVMAVHPPKPRKSLARSRRRSTKKVK